MLKKLLLTIIATVICLYSTPAQDDQLKYSPITDLEWKVTPVDSIYYPGGIPITFNFKITNTTSFPTRKYESFRFYLDVKHKGKVTRFTQLSNFTNDIMVVNKVIFPINEAASPKESYFEFSRKQNFNLGKIFREAGDYELTFVIPYEKMNGDLAEKTTNTITIKSEISRKNEIALKKLKAISSEFSGGKKVTYEKFDEYNDDSLYERLVKTQNGVEQLVGFGYEFPDSIYGQYALCLAVRWYKSQGKTEKVKEILAKLEGIEKSPQIAVEISQNTKKQ